MNFDSSHSVTRRLFLSTATGVATATVLMKPSEAGAAPYTLGDQVDVQIKIQWNNGTAVKDSRVYDHIPNRFLGATNADGVFFFTAANGTVIRLVEPRYGIQQALFAVRGETRRDGVKVSGDNALVMAYAEGWTL